VYCNLCVLQSVKMPTWSWAFFSSWHPTNTAPICKKRQVRQQKQRFQWLFCSIVCIWGKDWCSTILQGKCGPEGRKMKHKMETG
jgi:hypothetical protein